MTMICRHMFALAQIIPYSTPRVDRSTLEKTTSWRWPVATTDRVNGIVSRYAPHRTGVGAKRERETKKEPVDATHLQVLMLLAPLTTGYVSGA